MPSITRVHGVAKVAVADEDWFIGHDSSVSFYRITFAADISARLGPDSAFSAVIQNIETFATIIAIGALVVTATKFVVITETPDGVSAADLQTSLQALGTVDSHDLSATTVALLDTGLATDLAS